MLRCVLALPLLLAPPATTHAKVMLIANAALLSGQYVVS
jgi:hypothetical protein